MLKSYLKLRNSLKEIAYHLRKSNLKKTVFPEIINIETSITCNARCITCPHKDIKRLQNMPFSVYKKIIDECAKYQLKELHPFNYGEPFLYKDFITALKYARQKLPKTKIFVYSNGSAMTDSQIEEVVKNKLIDKVNFSLDAANSDTYKKVRGLDYKTTMNKIMKFISLNRELGSKIHVSVSFVINPVNEREISQFKQFWKNKVNQIHIGSDDGRAGNPFINKASKNPCEVIFNRTTILTDGSVVLCCVDTKGELVIGNINKQSLKEIWDSPLYEKIRQLHLVGKKSVFELCRNCYVRY